MKNFKYILMIGAFISSISAYSAKGVDDGSRFGTGEDSIRCIENLSLYSSYYKIKDYESAYNSWKIVYDECPKAGGRTLYSQGAFLIATKMSKEKDVVKKQEWFKMLMECYDKRIQYFGDDKNYPGPWIRGRQAIDYINYSGDVDLITKALPWLKTAVDYMGEQCDADVMNAYFQMLEKQYESNKDQYRTNFINEYLRLGSILDGRIAKADKYVPNYQLVRNNINQMFTNSGAADCATLEGVFASKVETSKDNVDELGTIITLFSRAGCKESDVYFKASLYAHKLNPTAETAAGCGYQATKKKEYSNAVRFFNEAIKLADNDSVKYEYQYIIAALEMQMDHYTEARAAARRAIELDPSNGAPYILIAQMYADNSHNPYTDDKILAKTVYWAAVDKLEKAKSVDPSIADKAQQLINTYRKFYPSKEDVFFKPELNVGELFLIGGWIGETVRCRD